MGEEAVRIAAPSAPRTASGRIVVMSRFYDGQTQPKRGPGDCYSFFFIIVVKMLFSLEFGTPDMYGRSVGPDIFLVVR